MTKKEPRAAAGEILAQKYPEARARVVAPGKRASIVNGLAFRIHRMLRDTVVAASMLAARFYLAGRQSR